MTVRCVCSCALCLLALECVCICAVVEEDAVEGYTFQFNDSQRDESTVKQTTVPKPLRGYLHKKGAKRISGWKKRWFVLKDNRLTRYANKVRRCARIHM